MGKSMLLTMNLIVIASVLFIYSLAKFVVNNMWAKLHKGLERDEIFIDSTTIQPLKVRTHIKNSFICTLKMKVTMAFLTMLKLPSLIKRTLKNLRSGRNFGFISLKPLHRTALIPPLKCRQTCFIPMQCMPSFIMLHILVYTSVCQHVFLYN